MNYARFRENCQDEKADANLGPPTLSAIYKLAPVFFVGTGDNVHIPIDHVLRRERL